MSDHLLHVTIDSGRPVYRMECIDPLNCDIPLLWEDTEKASAIAKASLLRTVEGQAAWDAALNRQELNDLLHDEWAAICDQPWPWVLADPPECWAKHVMEFAEDCELFENFDWPGEISGPIKVRVVNQGGSPDDFAPQVEPVDA